MAEPRVIVDPQDIRSGKNGTGTAIGAYLFVKSSTTVDDGIVLPGAVTDDVLGVTMRAVPDGTYGDVQIRGLAKVTAGAAFSRGDRLMVTTAGKVIAWTAAGGANAGSVATAKRAAAADGDVVEAELHG